MHLGIRAPLRPRAARLFGLGFEARWTILAAATLAGCAGEPEGSTITSIPLADENNYTSDSSLQIPRVETAPGADLDICWTAVESDLQCHDVAPEREIDNVGLLRFLHLSEEQIQAKLTAAQLSQSEIDGYLDFHTAHTGTCTKLSSLSFFGTEVDVAEEYVESAERVYMLLFSKGTTPGVGARTMIFLEPSSSSTNTRVDAPAGCGLLSYRADLASVTPLSVPARGPWTIDWRDVTRDGQGNELVFESIDSVLLGFFGGFTVSELEQRIFDLELLATDLWEVPLRGGRTASLGNARHRVSGERFAGFEREEAGVWVLGLMCSTCQNPAPVLLTVLSPQAGER